MAKTVTTRGGRKLTPADIDTLAERAEAGFDLSEWKPRRGRPALDGGAGDPSPRIAVRLPQLLHQRVTKRAAAEHRSVSDVVRELLQTYADRR